MICRAIPYEGKEPYLFISYCHADQEKLYPLFEQMASEGCRLWYDDGNRPGEDWLENIENHLEQSHICLAFISTSSSLSHNCKREIIYALKCRKKVVPVLIEDAELPKGLRMQLVDMHYLKRWDYPSDGDLLKKLLKIKEIKDCKADNSTGMLRSAAEPHSPKQEAPSFEKRASIFSQLLQGNLKPKSAPLPHELSVKPVQEPAPEEAEHGQKAVSPKKVQLFSKQPKPEWEAPIAAKSDSPSKIVGAPDAFSPYAYPEVFDSPQEGSDFPGVNATLLKTTYPLDDERTILGTDFDDEKTVEVPRFSPALLLCPGRNQAFILTKPQISLGRSPIKCDVVIEGNSYISKHHADIIMLNGKYFLSDFGSTNGTFLNGEKLEPGKQVQLEPTAVFKLHKELMIFFGGPSVNRLIRRNSICFLMNEDNSAARIIDEEVVPLDRTHRWPDGTLADQEIHRNAHAAVCRNESDCSLRDENSRNGTYLNGDRLDQGASAPLASGDQITLGQTTLRFYSIPLKGDN